MTTTTTTTRPSIIVDDVQQDLLLRHTHSFKETFIARIQKKKISDLVPGAARRDVHGAARASPSPSSATTARASRPCSS